MVLRLAKPSPSILSSKDLFWAAFLPATLNSDFRAVPWLFMWVCTSQWIFSLSPAPHKRLCQDALGQVANGSVNLRQVPRYCGAQSTTGRVSGRGLSPGCTAVLPGEGGPLRPGSPRVSRPADPHPRAGGLGARPHPGNPRRCRRRRW